MTIKCPHCYGPWKYKGKPVDILCDRHYRMYLATYSVFPTDLDAYRQKVKRDKEKARSSECNKRTSNKQTFRNSIERYSRAITAG